LRCDLSDFLLFFTQCNIIFFSLTFSFLFLLKLELDFSLCIIYDSLIVSKLLSLEGVLELDNGRFLHVTSDTLIKNNWGNNNSLYQETFVGKDEVKMIKHTMSMICSSEGVSLLSFNWSSHCSNFLFDVSIDNLINLWDICDKLLNKLVFINNCEQKW